MIPKVCIAVKSFTTTPSFFSLSLVNQRAERERLALHVDFYNNAHMCVYTVIFFLNKKEKK